MNPLRQIASHISQAFADKTDLNIRLSNQRKDLEARQLGLVPLEGWPGKNADERKINEQRAYAADPTYQQIEAEIRRLEDLIALAETALETAINQRRAEEWIIRAKRLEMRRLEFGLLDQPDHNNFDDDGLDDQEDDLLDDFADDVADAKLKSHLQPV